MSTIREWLDEVTDVVEHNEGDAFEVLAKVLAWTQTQDGQVALAIARGKEEITVDLGVQVSSRGDVMPTHPHDFSTLHDYVDANTYAGLCDDDEVSAVLQPHVNEIQSALSGWLTDRRNNHLSSCDDWWWQGGFRPRCSHMQGA